MNILVVGSGGREHTIIKKLKESRGVDTIYALPGNGGIAADAICVNIGAKDIDGIVNFAKENKIGFAVVAPDDPLVLGAVDALNAKGVMCYLTFGPYCTEACEGEVTAQMLDEYSTAFGEKLNAIRISDQSSYNFPKQYFFEMYHMTREGRELRTEQLIEDLNAQFEREA